MVSRRKFRLTVYRWHSVRLQCRVNCNLKKLKRRSMNTLLPNTWLGDKPLNFYMNKVINNMDKRRCREHPTRRRSHCFRSFFFTNALGHNNIYDYERVKNHGNFVPGRNMFDLKYLFFPYNYKNVHWSGVAVFVEEKRINC